MSTNLCIEDYDLPHYEEGQTMNLSYVDHNRIPHSTTQQNVSLDCYVDKENVSCKHPILSGPHQIKK